MSIIRSIQISNPGEPSQMTIINRDLPDPHPDHIQINHKAIGVNFIDTYHRSGLYPVPLPSGIGLEAAGIVTKVGKNVHTWKTGDRAVYCSGPIGSYSEAHNVNASQAVKLPHNIEFDAAASLLLKGLTTQYLIRQIYPVKPGDTVLFHAGAGGVGQISLQWLRHLGVRTITTVGSDQKAQIAKAMGADVVINYATDPIAERVRAEIPDGVPVVFDGVGKDTFEASLDSLQRRGLLVNFGNASGPVTSVDLGILAKKGSLFLTRPTLYDYVDTQERLQAAADDLFNTIENGGITPPIPTVYPLEQAVQAHEDLENRRTTGSLILRP